MYSFSGKDDIYALIIDEFFNIVCINILSIIQYRVSMFSLVCSWGSTLATNFIANVKDGKMFTLGDSFNFTCKAGYSLNKSDATKTIGTAKCLDNHTFSYQPCEQISKFSL